MTKTVPMTPRIKVSDDAEYCATDCPMLDTSSGSVCRIFGSLTGSGETIERATACIDSTPFKPQAE